MPSTPNPPLGAPYAWFVGSVASWFSAWGMQQVLFAWLVVGVLREEPEWVGAALMTQALPSLGFLLWGGARADRAGRRRNLVIAHAAGAAAVASLGVVVAFDALTLPLLLIYAFIWGSVHALPIPARDALLYDVGRTDLMRAVTGTTLAQFIFQGAGNRLAGAAAILGTPQMLFCQAALLLVGIAPVSRLPASRSPQNPKGATGSTVAQIRDGFREVMESESLRSVALLVTMNGLFMMGPFFTIAPLLLRDYYGGDIVDLSWMTMMFPLGTIAGSLVLLWLGNVRRKGRASLLGLVGAGACVMLLGSGPPFIGLLAIVFVWGACVAVFLNTSRTLFQQEAPPSHRARVLAIYSLGMLGMAPLSNLLCGLLAAAVGPLEACVLTGGAMISAMGLCAVLTPIRRI